MDTFPWGPGRQVQSSQLAKEPFRKRRDLKRNPFHRGKGRGKRGNPAQRPPTSTFRQARAKGGGGVVHSGVRVHYLDHDYPDKGAAAYDGCIR